MLWNEVRKAYPNKWIVFDSLKQHEEDNKLIIEDIAIIEVFDDINKAYKYYCELHKQNKTRQLNISSTKETELQYKIKRIGIIK